MNNYTHHMATQVANDHHRNLVRAAEQQRLADSGATGAAGGLGQALRSRLAPSSRRFTTRRRVIAAAGVGLSAVLAISAVAVAAPDNVTTPVVAQPANVPPYSDNLVVSLHLRAV